MGSILLFGDDEILLRTRAAVLRSKGMAVACSSPASAAAVLQGRERDLVVLCHSLSEELCRSLVTSIRAQWPAARILLLLPQRIWWREEALEKAVDGMCVAEPTQLIAAVLKLLGDPAPPMPREVPVRGGTVRAGPFAACAVP